MKNSELLEMKIFIVDNDKYNVLLIEALLREAGFENLFCFYSAEELLHGMNKEIPDLVLSDIMMPRMNGYELCKTIKSSKIWQHIPIIMITAATMHGSESLKLSFENGAMDFIGKPVNEIELIARVKSALKLEKQRQQLEQALIQVQTLQGLLPICSYCKKIRSDNNYWQEIEMYISSHSEAEFSHSICPECYDKHVLPQILEIRNERLNKK